MKILYKKARTIIHNGQEKVVSKPGKWIITNLDKDFHIHNCMIPKEELHKEGAFKVDKDEFCIFTATPGDVYKNIKREVQLITLKDLGFIAATIGVHKEMVFADSGTGSGGSCLFFAPLVKKVYSYDIREDAKTKVSKDIERLGITNIELETKSIYDSVKLPEKVDAFLLDVPEPWHAWPNMIANVKIGGWVVGYTPSANQMHNLVNKMPENFIHEKSCELIERKWKVKGMALRPSTADFSHTAFLSFFRRLS